MRVKAKQFKVYNNGIEEEILALRGEPGSGGEGADMSIYALKSEIPDISGKQDKITDLQNIRDNVAITNSLTESTENNMISAINLYKVGDCAVWDNKLWRTIKEHRGQMPYEGSQYWERLSLKSLATDLDSVRTGAARGASTFGDSSVWDANTSYVIGSHVIYDNKLWRAITANQNSVPSSSNGNWQLISLSALDTPSVYACTSKMSTVNTSNLKIMKMGNVAVISGYIQVSDGVLTSGMNFASFPDACLPMTNVGMSWYVTAMTSTKKCSHVLVGQTSGQGLTLYINESGNSTVVFNGTWITKSL